MLDDRPPVSTKLKYDFVTAVCEQMKIHLGIIIEEGRNKHNEK